MEKRSSVPEKIFRASLGPGLRGLALMLNRTARKDPMLGRSLNELKGAYRFQNGDGSFKRHILIGGGKARMVKDLDQEPNFTFTIRDPSGFNLRSRADNVLDLIVSNKVGQSGNLYYLFQFGFIMSLMERSIRKR